MRLQTLSTHIVAHGSLLSRHTQESLSGTARVHLIVNVSPSDTSVHETFSSLLFGQRAMAVTVSPVRPIGVDTLLAQLVLLHTPHPHPTTHRQQTWRLITRPWHYCCSANSMPCWIDSAHRTGVVVLWFHTAHVTCSAMLSPIPCLLVEQCHGEAIRRPAAG